MVNRTKASALVALLVVSFCAEATDNDLIRSLYHADFIEYDDEPKKPFTLDGELGLLFATGNTNASSLKASLNSEHDGELFANQYWVEFLYKESEVDGEDGPVEQTTAQRLFAYAQADYKLTKQNRRLFVYGDYEDDRFNGFDYRSSIATGWSQLLWRNDISEFRFSVGPGYSFAKLDSGETADNIHGFILRGSAEYHYIWPTGARFRQFASAEVGEQNIKSRSETSLSANLFESLALKLSLILQHNSNPADNIRALNTETSVTVVYRFF